MTTPDRPLRELVDGDLAVVLRERFAGDAERGLVPAYLFDLLVDTRVVGDIELRLGDGESQLRYAGHIAYAVDEVFRGHRYAERACRLIAPLANAHALSPIWITCRVDNAASRRTCERLGAQLIEIVAVPVGHAMYERGYREICRFTWTT